MPTVGLEMPTLMSSPWREFISAAAGGCGVARELIEEIMKTQGTWPAADKLAFWTMSLNSKHLDFHTGASHTNWRGCVATGAECVVCGGEACCLHSIRHVVASLAEADHAVVRDSGNALISTRFIPTAFRQKKYRYTCRLSRLKHMPTCLRRRTHYYSRHNSD